MWTADAGASILPNPKESYWFGAAFGVNVLQEIVGYAYGEIGMGEVAAIWRDDEAIDLNDLIMDGSSWKLRRAYDINTRGQIVGAGVLSGVYRQAFLLDPKLLGDLNGDGTVDVLDLLELLGSWGPCPNPPLECPADLDANGTVDVLDLLIILAHWS